MDDDMKISNDDLFDTSERGMQNPLRFSHAGIGDSLSENPDDMFQGMTEVQKQEYTEYLRQAGFSPDGTNGNPNIPPSSEETQSFEEQYSQVHDHIAKSKDPEYSLEHDPTYPWWDFGTTRNAIDSLMGDEMESDVD